MKYVPEQDTDFIFCTVGEEQGFLGASAVLIVFGLFILRLIVLAERQDNAFGRVYGYSVASIFFFDLIVYFSSFGRFSEGALVEEGKTRKPIS